MVKHCNICSFLIFRSLFKTSVKNFSLVPLSPNFLFICFIEWYFTQEYRYFTSGTKAASIIVGINRFIHEWILSNLPHSLSLQLFGQSAQEEPLLYGWEMLLWLQKERIVHFPSLGRKSPLHISSSPAVYFTLYIVQISAFMETLYFRKKRISYVVIN